MKFPLYFILLVLSTASFAQDQVIILTTPVVKVYAGSRHGFYRGANRVIVNVDVRDGRVVNARHAGRRHYHYNRHAYRNLRNFAWNMRNSAFIVRDRTRHALRRVE